MADRHMGEESKGLKKPLLADYSQQIGARKNDAGLTEETDKMIREAEQSCHWIEKRKEIDDMLCTTEIVRK